MQKRAQNKGERPINIIQETRKIIAEMNPKQRIRKAAMHLQDALRYKQPRPFSQRPNMPSTFLILYWITSSYAWEYLLFYLSYIYMFLIILDEEHYQVKIGLEASILSFMVIDYLANIYCKSFDYPITQKGHLRKIIVKGVLLLLNICDLLIFIVLPGFEGRPIRPLRIFRGCVPLIYDIQVRKTFQSFLSALEDILAFIVFYCSMICLFAVVGSKILHIDPNLPHDPYQSDYTSLNHMIFIIYVTGSYDSYPDNQMVAIDQQEWNILFFIVFIFLNMFLFSSIPGSLIYVKFRQTRTKIILQDEIRQQNSLIIAFVTILDHQHDLSIQQFINFLLFVYKKKIRYIEHITDICIRLDQNNSKAIQVNEFMLLANILLSNSYIYPPSFDDLEGWIKFRKYVNKRFHIKTIVTNWVYELFVSILIIYSIVNSLLYLTQLTLETSTVDTVLVALFAVELMLRIIGIGPQIFFLDTWNKIDFFIIILNCATKLVDNQLLAISILKIFRCFRIATLIKMLPISSNLMNKSVFLYSKLSNLFNTIVTISSIILKYFPFILVVYFFFGIIGMEIFYSTYNEDIQTDYSQYDKYSSFRTFVKSQFLLVQLLTEAGWSLIAFDHAKKNQSNFGYVMGFFCFSHIIVVLIVATLIKGIFWEVYLTVENIYTERWLKQKEEKIYIEQTLKRREEYAQIGQILNSMQYFVPDSIVKRELYENKIDYQIFQKIVDLLNKEQSNKKSPLKRKFSKAVDSFSSIFAQNKLNFNKRKQSSEINEPQKSQVSSKQSSEQLALPLLRRRNSKLSDISKEQIDEADFQFEMERMIQKILIKENVKFQEKIQKPKLFLEFLSKKLKIPFDQINEHSYNMNTDPIMTGSSLLSHIHQLYALVGIETSKREQKALIIKNLIQEGVIQTDVGQNLLKKNLMEKVFQIQPVGTLRKMFLSDTNQSLITKFQIQYFSDTYGISFKDINKITLEPLLRLQSTLTYTLRNILRYPHMEDKQFFQILTKIEDSLSNRLLKHGSLAKFVYKIEYHSDVWFSIEYKKQQEMRVHFLKNGVWISDKLIKNETIYYAKDVFHWQINDHPQKQTCRRHMKKFYQSFEGLAFSLLEEDKFFISNPQFTAYDLFLQIFNVKETARHSKRRIKISKIMMVMLSREEDRPQDQILPYKLSDITPFKSKKKNTNVRYNEQKMLQKIKSMAIVNEDKIVETEGLPYAYIINLMREIHQILNVSMGNFVYKIEAVINGQLEETEYFK